MRGVSPSRLKDMKIIEKSKIALAIIAILSLVSVGTNQTFGATALRNIQDTLISEELQPAKVQKLRSDGQGKIYFGTCSEPQQPAFMVQFDSLTLTAKKFGYLNTAFPTSGQCTGDVAIDVKGNVVWFALLTGELARLDLSTETTTLFRFSNDPPGNTNLALVDRAGGIVIGIDGTIWLGVNRQQSPSELLSFDPATDIFTSEQIFPSGIGNFFLSGTDIYITGIDGISKFDTMRILPMTTVPVPDFAPLDLTEAFGSIWFSERKTTCTQDPNPNALTFSSFVGQLDLLTGKITHHLMYQANDTDCTTSGVTVDVKGFVWTNADSAGLVKKACEFDPFGGLTTCGDTPSGVSSLETFGGSVYYYGIGSVHTGKITQMTTVVLKAKTTAGVELTAPVTVDRDTVTTLSVLTFRTNSVHSFTSPEIEGKTFVGWVDQNGAPLIGVDHKQGAKLMFKAATDTQVVALYQ